MRLDGLADVLQLAREQVTIAERTLAAERELYREGRNPLNFVLEALQGVQRARRAMVDQAAQYHAQLMHYRELTDQLLESGR